MATPNTTLYAALDDLLGNAAGSTANPAKLRIALCGYGPSLPRISGTAMLAKVGPYDIYSTGAAITINLWGNDQIVPANTYYQISILDGNDNLVQTAAYQFAAGSYDLSTLTPYIPFPGPPTPADAVLKNPSGGLGVTQVINSNIEIKGNLTVDGTINFSFLFSTYTVPINAGTPFFNGSLGYGQYIILTQNVTSSTIANMPQGFPIQFIIKQDGTGGRTFAWPANFVNPPDINEAANGVTVSTWTKAPDGNYYQCAAAVWS